VAGIGKHGLGFAELNDSTRIHYRNTIGHFLHDCHVVCYEDDPNPSLFLYRLQMSQVRSLNGDVKGGRWFIGNQQCRIAAHLTGPDVGAARIGEAHGYDEINLNVGCPSDRVQSGRFGACLMAEPETVGACVESMKAAVAVPVTVKCRLGIDDQDIEEPLDCFVATMREAGADAVIVHARKAWLAGLSPKENREVPPLNHGRVHRLKAAHPGFPIVLNGGLQSLDEAESHLGHVDGVMFGRAAYQRPALLTEVDQRIFGDPRMAVSPLDAVEGMRPYIARELGRGTPLHHLTRPMLGLFHGGPGARRWRRILTVDAQQSGAGVEVLDQALSALEPGAARHAA
jgi:tRNA-dihydrouridine synthase A